MARWADNSSADEAKHGIDENPESVASHVATVLEASNEPIDCVSTFAAYITLREHG